MSHFSVYASIKLILGLIGSPRWTLFILDAMEDSPQEWGEEKYLNNLVGAFNQLLCKRVSRWICAHNCSMPTSIPQMAFEDMVTFNVAPFGVPGATRCSFCHRLTLQNLQTMKCSSFAHRLYIEQLKSYFQPLISAWSWRPS